jgi:hypothetical protein
MAGNLCRVIYGTTLISAWTDIFRIIVVGVGNRI